MNENLPDKITAKNDRTLKQLAWAIDASGGKFSLILLRCNYRNLRETLLEKLQGICTGEIRAIEVDRRDRSLYRTVATSTTENAPAAIAIVGLEAIDNPELFWGSADRVREEFQKNCPFPVLLCLDDMTYKTFRQFATNLEDWTTSKHFLIPAAELKDFLSRSVDRCFDNNTKLTRKETDRLAAEVAMARKDMQQLEAESDGEMQANLESLSAFVTMTVGQFDAALEGYDRAIELWQPIFPTRLAQILVKKGVCLYLKVGKKWRSDNNEVVILSANDRDAICNCLEESWSIFEAERRLDRVVELLSDYDRVLRFLQDWDRLQQLADRVVEICNTEENLHSLARAYGCLAEVALHREQFEAAERLANKAIETWPETTADELSEQRSRFYFTLARSQAKRDRLDLALQNLEIARSAVDPSIDLYLYLYILQSFYRIYRRKKAYLQAFEIVKEILAVESYYGIIAFIGAGRLVARPGEDWQAQRDREMEVAMAPEIVASGRDEDVRELVKRLQDNHYKIVVIYGNSGTGKSSLIDGGLMPVLQKQNMLIGYADVISVALRRYDNWIQELGEKLAVGFRRNRKIPCEKPFDTIASILSALQQCADRPENDLRVVLVFDQFEEFFFSGRSETEINEFFEFLGNCLEVLSVKVILSLRRDYLHLLVDRPGLQESDFDVLNQKNRYAIGYFDRDCARMVIDRLTARSSFQLQPDLVDRLVEDLAKDGKISPIELQIVGMQLQVKNITTLAKYQEWGVDRLVGSYLDTAIAACGTENAIVAELVLYLLTDEKGTRPLKTRSALAEGLAELLSSRLTPLPEGKGSDDDTLGLVLTIFTGFGLVMELSGSPEQYQLVHDYLATLVRGRQRDGLVAQLERERKERQRAEKQARETQAKLNRVLKRALAVAAVAVLALGGITTYAVRESRRAEQESIRAEKGEIRALQSAARAKLASHQELEALIEAVRLGRQLKETYGSRANEQTEALAAMAEVVYGVREKNRFEGYEDVVSSVSFSPDGQIIASTGDGGHDIQLHHRDGTLLATLDSHRDFVESICFSRDGQTIASASYDKTVKLWNLEGELLHTFKGHEALIRDVRFSPDGRSLASGSRNGKIRLWSLEGETLAVFSGHKKDVVSISFNSDGQQIASASLDGTIKLWKTNGELLQTFQGHDDGVTSVTFSPDNKIIVSGNSKGEIRFWELNGTPIRILSAHGGRINSLIFSPDSKTLISTSDDRTVKFWNMEDGKLVKIINGHRDKVHEANFSPDGHLLVTGSTDFTVKIWSLENTGFKVIPADIYTIQRVRFSPNGQILASAGNDTTAKLWDVETGDKIVQLSKHDHVVSDVAFSPDGQTVASISWDGNVKLWNRQGQLLRTLEAYNCPGGTIGFSHNGRMLASGGCGGTIKIWNLDGSQLRTWKAHSRGVRSFSLHGDFLASASWDGTAKLWNWNGILLQTFSGHSDVVADISFSSDGKMLASASLDGTVKLWSREGALLKTIVAERNRVWGVSFNPGNQTLVSVGDSGIVKVWSLDGRLLKSLTGRQGALQGALLGVDVSPDGKTLSTAGSDGAIVLWNLDEWTLDVDALLDRGCNWLEDYLKHSPNVTEDDRQLCGVEAAPQVLE